MSGAKSSTGVSFTELVNGLARNQDGQFSTVITDNWMQGRTTYGGLSVALCLKAVQLEFDNLAPLRSAQVNFIGPSGGKVSFKTKVMRQGRSVSYISAEMFSEQGLATHVVFCFGAKRKSRLNEQYSAKPKVPDYQNSTPFFADKMRPAFACQYETMLAQGGMPISGSSENEHFLWTRHIDKQADDMVALLGIADMAPPAVMPMFKEFAPISSMTWMVNILSHNIETKDGWWLQRSAAENASDGYSSQDMQIWNTNGDLIISARQQVAIFY